MGWEEGDGMRGGRRRDGRRGGEIEGEEVGEKGSFWQFVILCLCQMPWPSSRKVARGRPRHLTDRRQAYNLSEAGISSTTFPYSPD